MTSTDTRQSTARSKGAVGQQAIVPRVVRDILEKHECYQNILDFGAGPGRKHVNNLKKQFDRNIQGYDLGDDRDILEESWNLVYASNVLNVQTTIEQLLETLADLWIAQGDGDLIVNYPKEPRKMGLTPTQMEECLFKFGWEVERVQGVSKNNVWKLHKYDKIENFHGSDGVLQTMIPGTFL